MLEDLDKVGEFIKNVGTGLLGIASFMTAIAGLAEKWKKTSKPSNSHRKKKRNHRK